ncbi:MAG: hypothetical protein PHV66_09925 [Bacteroidales bacterium]|nr:hypothetical protein [Bacteroidales bacterium]
MNKNNKLFWAVILLLVLNVTTISTIIWQNRSVSGPTNCLRVASEGCKLTGKNIDRQLGFNAKQMEAFKEANREFTPRSCMILCKLDSLKNEMFVELQQVPSDSLRLDSLAQMIGDQHAALKRETIHFYNDIKKVCTPEQEKKLQDVFYPLFRNETPGSGKGKGFRHGKNKDPLDTMMKADNEKCACTI